MHKLSIVFFTGVLFLLCEIVLAFLYNEGKLVKKIPALNHGYQTSDNNIGKSLCSLKNNRGLVVRKYDSDNEYIHKVIRR